MKLFPIFGIVVLSVLSGCGGSGSGVSGNDQNQHVVERQASIGISWPAQTGASGTPASAQSARIAFVNQDPIVPLQWTAVNRLSSPSAYSQTYQVKTDAFSSPLTHVDVEFYSEPNATGSVVGAAAAGGTLTTEGVLVDSNGQAIAPLSPADPLAQVSMMDNVPGLSVKVGATLNLQVVGIDPFGTVFPLPPGPAIFTQQTTAFATLTTSGVLTGVTPGYTFVTVTYQGLSSGPTQVKILAP